MYQTQNICLFLTFIVSSCCFLIKLLYYAKISSLKFKSRSDKNGAYIILKPFNFNAVAQNPLHFGALALWFSYKFALLYNCQTRNQFVFEVINVQKDISIMQMPVVFLICIIY